MSHEGGAVVSHDVNYANELAWWPSRISITAKPIHHGTISRARGERPDVAPRQPLPSPLYTKNNGFTFLMLHHYFPTLACETVMNKKSPLCLSREKERGVVFPYILSCWKCSSCYMLMSLNGLQIIAGDVSWLIHNGRHREVLEKSVNTCENYARQCT